MDDLKHELAIKPERTRHRLVSVGCSRANSAAVGVEIESWKRGQENQAKRGRRAGEEAAVLGDVLGEVVLGLGQKSGRLTQNPADLKSSCEAKKDEAVDETGIPGKAGSWCKISTWRPVRANSRSANSPPGLPWQAIAASFE